MKSLLNKKSVFTKLLTTYSVMSVITALFIGIVSYQVSTTLYANQIEEDSALLLEQYRALIETDIMKPAEKIAMELLVNGEYRDINNFFKDDLDYGDIYWYNKELEECLLRDRDLTRDIYLHNLNNNVILSAQEGLLILDTRDYYWWALEGEEQSPIVGWSIHYYESNIQGLRYRHSYPLTGGTTKGYIVVDVAAKNLLDIMESLSAYQDGELLLLDAEGKVIPIVGAEFAAILDGDRGLEQDGGGFLASMGKEEYYCTYSSSFANGWRLAMMTTVTDFYASSLLLQRIIAVLTVLCIVVGLFLSVHFSRNIYQPVKDIMGRLQKGDKKSNFLMGNEYEFIDRELLHLNTTVQELNGMLQSYNPMIEYNILSGLISKTMRDRSVLQQRISLLGLRQDMPCVTAVVIGVRDLLFDIMDEKNLQIFKIHLINLVREICGKQCIVSEYKEDEIAAMVFHEEGELLPICKKLEEKCSIYPVGSLSIGVGDSFDDFMNFSDSYEEAKEALQYSYFDAGKVLFDYATFHALQTPETDILGVYNKEFDKHVKAGNLEEALDTISRIEQVVKTFPFKYEYMNRKLLEMVGYFARYCKEMGIKTSDENMESRFLNADRLHDFLIPFQEMVTEVISRRNVDMENKNENLIVAACEYIEANLSEDISINMIADQIGVSEGHLSRMFKKTMNKNIVEYITEKRMEEAKRLLTETSFSIEKIANMSGYRTPHYFGKKFKEAYGYTPSEYREMVKRRGE